MPPTPETLTDLVATRVGEGRPLTYRAFETQAIDPESGYQPSKGILWKVAHDQTVKISPGLIRAIAAGLGLPPERVQRAAAYQYTGYIATQHAGGTIVHEPGVTLDQMPKARAVLERWDTEGD